MTTKIKTLAKTFSVASIIFLASCAKTPVGCFTTDKGKTAKVNEEIQFNASCSTDADTYLWDYGDCSTGSGSSTKHKYSTAKIYSVMLKVSNKSKSSSISQDVTINP